MLALKYAEVSDNSQINMSKIILETNILKIVQNLSRSGRAASLPCEDLWALFCLEWLGLLVKDVWRSFISCACSEHNGSFSLVLASYKYSWLLNNTGAVVPTPAHSQPRTENTVFHWVWLNPGCETPGIQGADCIRIYWKKSRIGGPVQFKLYVVQVSLPPLWTRY